MLKKMDPPKSAGWLTLNLDDVVDASDSDDDGDVEKPAAAKPESDKDIWPLFNRTYVITDHAQVPDHLQKAKANLKLNTLSNDLGLLAAASVLEQSVNNTSLFFVLEIGGLRLLFPGDAQYGAWEHVRDNPEAMELIRDVDFYKMGHHGSHNATPMTLHRGTVGQARRHHGPVGPRRALEGHHSLAEADRCPHGETSPRDQADRGSGR